MRSFGPERVDRCMTCHIAIDDPRFATADQPLRTHPPIPGHKFETFGCTICHDGQGRAVDAKGAHEGGEDWPWPLLQKDMIEANCVQCHAEPGWAGAPLVSEGRALFFERACYTCHTIAGLSYGSIGPELTEVGRKRRRVTFIEGKISDPRATNPTSTMPKQDLGKEQVAALVTFLKAQQGARIAKAPLAAVHAPPSRSAPSGCRCGHRRARGGPSWRRRRRRAAARRSCRRSAASRATASTSGTARSARTWPSRSGAARPGRG